MFKLRTEQTSLPMSKLDIKSPSTPPVRPPDLIITDPTQMYKTRRPKLPQAPPCLGNESHQEMPFPSRSPAFAPWDSPRGRDKYTTQTDRDTARTACSLPRTDAIIPSFVPPVVRSYHFWDTMSSERITCPTSDVRRKAMEPLSTSSAAIFRAADSLLSLNGTSGALDPNETPMAGKAYMPPQPIFLRKRDCKEEGYRRVPDTLPCSLQTPNPLYAATS